MQPLVAVPLHYSMGIVGLASSVWVDTHEGHLQCEQLDLQWELWCHRVFSGSF